MWPSGSARARPWVRSSSIRDCGTSAPTCSGREHEPSPVPRRVLLSTERDALDMPRAKLDWRLTALDRRSFRAFYEVMGRELGRSGAGRVQLLDWVTRDEDTWPGTLSGGWHHMGTTRMHENPRLGVVDANCRVHGLGNLYVAGTRQLASTTPKRSEEHTSELQSLAYLVCRLLLEKKKNTQLTGHLYR